MAGFLDDRPVLVLNASYEPINICGARRAIKMLVLGKAAVEAGRERTADGRIEIPSVIRLARYRKVPMRRHTVSRKNILLRDRHVCQYCGLAFAPARLTLDHVVPRAKGGESAWENLVACCEACNRRKADRTPLEAGMPLVHPPRPMTLHTGRHILRASGADDPKWREYLYY